MTAVVGVKLEFCFQCCVHHRCGVIIIFGKQNYITTSAVLSLYLENKTTSPLVRCYNYLKMIKTKLQLDPGMGPKTIPKCAPTYFRFAICSSSTEGYAGVYTEEFAEGVGGVGKRECGAGIGLLGGWGWGWGRGWGWGDGGGGEGCATT
jgi:hypothetical protein